MIVSFAFLISEQRVAVWRGEAGVGREGVRDGRLPESPTDRLRTMIQLPSDFSLPPWPALLQSSGRNVAQIRVSARWGG